MIKRPFILLEILIAIGLFALLMSFLLGTLYQWTRLSQSSTQYSLEVEKRVELKYRLQSLFDHILMPIKQSKVPFVFYTEDIPSSFTRGQSLVFSFDNSLDPSPLFSATQTAKLYLNTDHQLCLTLWPALSEQGPLISRTEVLFENIDDCQWEFFMPPTQRDIELKIDDREKRPLAGLHKDWKKEWSILPAIVWLTLHHDQTVQKLGFVLYQANLPLLFPMEQGAKT
jgi:type II secretory pathway pseudopilin PulG